MNELKIHPECECDCHCRPVSPCDPVIDGVAWCCSPRGLAFNEQVRENFEALRKQIREQRRAEEAKKSGGRS